MIQETALKHLMPISTRRRHSWARMKIYREVKVRMIGNISIISFSDTSIRLSEILV
jgi:hypothetical protein